MPVFQVGRTGGGSYVGGGDYISLSPSEAALASEVVVAGVVEAARLSLSHPLTASVLPLALVDAHLAGTIPIASEVVAAVVLDTATYLRLTHALTAEALVAAIVEARLNPLAPPSRLGPNGIVAVMPRIYRADKFGVPIEDLSHWADGGSIGVDLDAPIAATLRVRLRDRERRRHADAWSAEWSAQPSKIRPYADWLLVTIHRRHQGGETFEEPLGLFTVDVPGPEIWPEVSFIDLTGKDACWILAQDRVAVPSTAVAGTNMIAHALAVAAGTGGGVAAASLPPPRIPASPRTFSVDTTWDAGKSRLEVINDCLEGAGYYTLKPDTRGQLYSTPYLRLADLHPAVTFTGDEGSIVVPPIDLDAVTTRIRNHVVVVRSDPRSTPIRVERFAPETSPVAVSKIGRRISTFIGDPHLADEAAAAEMADRLIEEGSSYYVRAKLRTLPTDAPDVRDAVRLNMTDRDNNPIRGVHGDVWWRSGWSMPLSPGGLMTHNLNRVTDFGT